MKSTRFLIIGALIVFGGCSLFSSPSSVVKKFMSAIEGGDIDTATSLWSSAAIEEQGSEKIRQELEYFSRMVRGARQGGQVAKVENMRETVQGNRARVFFLYRASAQNSVALGYALIKEKAAWKLYRSIDSGEEDQPFDISFGPRAPAKPYSSPSPLEMVSPPPPPPKSSQGATISGGVLNNRATSLPEPPYPPAARAVKASGTVVVQVVVDESGRVRSANAVSGHPLLKAAAEAAARQARFTPTIVGGKAVKINGTINYEFAAR